MRDIEFGRVTESQTVPPATSEHVMRRIKRRRLIEYGRVTESQAPGEHVPVVPVRDTEFDAVEAQKAFDSQNRDIKPAPVLTEDDIITEEPEQEPEMAMAER